ncbi:MAG: hypothetical protein JWP12_160 [Bacteroidetes bacterium]|nr:hypothetical protein [Bacteroidota bacterium]
MLLFDDPDSKKEILLNEMLKGGNIQGYIMWRNDYDSTTKLLSELVFEGLVNPKDLSKVASLTEKGCLVATSGGYRKWKQDTAEQKAKAEKREILETELAEREIDKLKYEKNTRFIAFISLFFAVIAAAISLYDFLHSK